MKTQSEKLKKIESLNEALFRKEVIVPLLKKMGYEKVRETHGPDELGKDIVFYEPSKLGGFHSAVVVKVGNISGAASGEKNLATVLTQIDMAFENPFFDYEDKQNYQINKVIVWTSGNISSSAQKQIQNQTAKLRNVTFFDGTKTIDLLEEHYPAYFTFGDPVVSDYFYAAREYYSRIEELRSLGGSTEQHRLPLIFVAPKFTEMREGPIDVKKYTGNIKSKNHQEVLFSDLLKLEKNYFIVGSAGSGKSALIRHILLTIIEQNETQMKRHPIPVIVDAKKVAWGEADCVESAIFRELNRFTKFEDEFDLSKNLFNGLIIVLIDGVDELRDEDKVKRALNTIKTFNKKYEKVRTVTTTRSLEVFKDPDVLAGENVLNMLPLSSEQMRKFVINWFGDASDVTKRLIQVIDRPFGLHGLPSTPLTLAIVSILFESGTKEIPANLTELFQQYTELVLGRWDTSKEISHKIEWRIKQFVLAKVSWNLHEKKSLSIDIEQLKNVAQTYADERGLPLDANAFVEEVIHRSELLVKHATEDYEFKHRSFQDYFCGVEISSHPDKLKILEDKFDDPWWTQANFFACGLQPQSESVLQHILDSVPIPTDNRIVYAVTLGQITQAIYAAPSATKEYAVDRVLDVLMDSWNDICKNFNEDEFNEDIPAQITLLFPFTLFAQQGLGSITLAPALEKIAKAISEVDLTALSADERILLEWKTYLVAMSCASCNHVEIFEDLFRSGILQDPSLLLAGLGMCKLMMDRYWFDEGDMLRIKTVYKRLDQKMKQKGMKKYLRDLKRSGPILLPEKSMGSS